MSNLNKKPLGDASTERRFRKECVRNNTRYCNFNTPKQ